jgi:hypothetical protein
MIGHLVVLRGEHTKLFITRRDFPTNCDRSFSPRRRVPGPDSTSSTHVVLPSGRIARIVTGRIVLVLTILLTRRCGPPVV